MKRWIHAATTDWDYTNFVDNEVAPAVEVFMELPDDEVDYNAVKDAVDEFREEYQQFPPNNSIDSLDIKYDKDKGRFYNKYRPFADKCKELFEKTNPSGYGRGDFALLKMRDLLKAVDYNFPYGWKSQARYL